MTKAEAKASMLGTLPCLLKGTVQQLSSVVTSNELTAHSRGIQAGWLILKSFPEHVDVLAFMNAIESLYGAKSFELACIESMLCAPVRGSLTGGCLLGIS